MSSSFGLWPACCCCKHAARWRRRLFVAAADPTRLGTAGVVRRTLRSQPAAFEFKSCPGADDRHDSHNILSAIEAHNQYAVVAVAAVVVEEAGHYLNPPPGLGSCHTRLLQLLREQHKRLDDLGRVLGS